MRTKFLILLFAVVTTVCCNAQNGRNIRVGYTFIDAMTIAPGALTSQDYLRSDAVLNSGYAVMVDFTLFEFAKRMSAGGHLGFSPSCYHMVGVTGSDGAVIGGKLEFFPGLHYGVDVQCELLSDAERWSLVMRGMLGSYWTLYSSPQVEYGLSVSFSYSMFKNWGLFLETGWGQYSYTYPNTALLYRGRTMLKGGVFYRF